jgi:hypothetical protein
MMRRVLRRERLEGAGAVEVDELRRAGGERRGREEHECENVTEHWRFLPGSPRISLFQSFAAT